MKCGITELGIQWTWHKFQFHLLAGISWPSHLILLSFSFLTWKSGIIIDSSSSNDGDANLNEIIDTRENTPSTLFGMRICWTKRFIFLQSPLTAHRFCEVTLCDISVFLFFFLMRTLSIFPDVAFVNFTPWLWFFSPFIFISWRLITLQYCSVLYSQTRAWSSIVA